MSTKLFVSLLLVFALSSCEFLEGPKKDDKQSSQDKGQLDENGTGLKVSHTEDGKLYSEIPYQDSLRHGKGKLYYESGKVKFEVTYKKGEKHGLETWFYEDGKPYRISNYKEGELDSIQVYYHDNGKLMAEVPYNNGKLCEGTKEFKKDGTRLSTPEIITQHIDEVALTSRYHIDVSVSRRMRKIEYSEVMDTENLPCPELLIEIPNVKGKRRLTIPVPKGTFQMSESIVAVNCTSYQRIPHLVTKRVAINATNRG